MISLFGLGDLIFPVHDEPVKPLLFLSSAPGTGAVAPTSGFVQSNTKGKNMFKKYRGLSKLKRGLHQA